MLNADLRPQPPASQLDRLSGLWGPDLLAPDSHSAGVPKRHKENLKPGDTYKKRDWERVRTNAGMREADRVFAVVIEQKESVIPIFHIGHRQQGNGANVRGDDRFADGADRERLASQLLATTTVPCVETD
jgi:hypothetical protein